MRRRLMSRWFAVFTLIALLSLGSAFSEEILSENGGTAASDAKAVAPSNDSAL